MVCDNVALTGDVTKISGEFRNKGQMTCLSRGAVHCTVDGADQRLVIGPGHELAAFKVVTKVMDGEV